ncbi:MAG: cupin domain-containing protein [Candidatus Margulisiibacteriota bacterium]
MAENKFQAGEVEELKGLIDYQSDSIVSRMLINKPNGSVTLFALAAGQSIAEHKTPFDALVNVLDGEAEIVISGKSHLVKAGEVLLMPANDPHALFARQGFKMLLTMVK